MTDCTSNRLQFPAFKRRKIQADLSGGDVTSDGDSLLFRQIDRKEILQTKSEVLRQQAFDQFEKSKNKQRLFGDGLPQLVAPLFKLEFTLSRVL